MDIREDFDNGIRDIIECLHTHDQSFTRLRILGIVFLLTPLQRQTLFAALETTQCPLESVVFNFCALDDLEIARIAAATIGRSLPTLRRFEITYSRGHCTATAAHHVATHLETTTSPLDTVYLTGNAIDDGGAVRLLEAIEANARLRISLQSLVLDDNRLTNVFADYLLVALRAGNACTLAPNDMRQVQRTIGAFASAILRRYVVSGNRNLTFVWLLHNDIDAARLAQIEAVLAVRESYVWQLEEND